MVAGNADPGRWAGAALSMPEAFAARSACEAHPASPSGNALRIAGGSIILVGHSSPLVEIGLLATLRKLTLHNVATLDELGALSPGSGGGKIDVVVADRAIASRLAKFAAGFDRSDGKAGPRILLIGAAAGTPPFQQDAPVSFDARLALECRQGDLVDAVNALIDSRVPEMPGPLQRTPGQCATDFSAGTGNGQADARFAVSSVGGTIHLMEGIALHAPRASAERPLPRGGLPPGALRRVREAMEQRLAEKLELTELAAVAGVSRCHFARAFKESVGQPPHRYLMARRIAVAAELIKDSDRTLTDISLDMGFFDQSHFARVFTRVVGETPSAYRRKHR